jgi:16S rRNA (guanine1516-N2)-methyltransferase
MANSAAPVFQLTDSWPALVFADGRKLQLDFSSDRYHRKLRGKNELLAKAVGIKTLTSAPKVWDLTLGFAEDAWTLARLGCQVQGFERQPELAKLVAASLEKYAAGVESGSHWDASVKRLSVHAASAHQVLQNFLDGTSHYPAPDVLYYDPMFAGTTKSSALPRLEMQLLRFWLGEDHDQAEVLHLARQIPGRRVVVKRAIKAPLLAEDCTHSFEGEKVRYDMYQHTGSLHA